MNFEKYNVNTPEDLMRFLEQNMRYGFKYRTKIFTEENKNFQKEMDKLYKLRLGDDFIKSGYGVCWDFCELEREFFLSKKIPHECYFIESFFNRNEGGPTHSFALFQQNGKWHWFEFSWGNQKGIWQFDTKEDALKHILEKYKQFYTQVGTDSKINLYKIPKFTKRMNTYEYVEKCINSQKITEKQL